MPIHDWTRVDAGLFHSFHQQWITYLCAALNAGGLPPGYYALAEQSIRGPVPDVLALRLAAAPVGPDGPCVAAPSPWPKSRRAPGSSRGPRPTSTSARRTGSRSGIGMARSWP